MTESTEDWQERNRCRVRYGRARLTIRRSGRLTTGPLGEAIDAYRRDDSDAEALAWTFARARVVEHTPSFSWEQADLTRLLQLVVGCSKSPRFTATEPRQLAAQLVGAEADEREQVAKLSEQWGRQLASIQPEVLKMARTVQLSPHLSQQLKKAQETVRAAMRVHVASIDLAAFQGPAIEALREASRIGFPDSALQARATALRANLALPDMRRFAAAAAQVAMEAEDDEAAEVFDAVAEIAEEADDAPEPETLEALRRLQAVVEGLQEQLKRRPNEYLLFIAALLVELMLFVLSQRS